MSAIQYIHDEQGIAHRDLKLENFLLDEKYVAMLSDFGLAVSMKTHDATHLSHLLSVKCGTPEYMAPEMCSFNLANNSDTITASTCQYDPFRADIYSMGICLFEMVNYYRPFSMNINDRNSESIIRRQLNKRYLYNNRIYLTEDCRNLIDEMLDPRPFIRPNASQVLEHNWFKYSIR